MKRRASRRPWPGFHICNDYRPVHKVSRGLPYTGCAHCQARAQRDFQRRMRQLTGMTQWYRRQRGITLTSYLVEVNNYIRRKHDGKQARRSRQAR